MPASSPNRLALGLAVMLAHACVSSVQSLVPETRPKALTPTSAKSKLLNRRNLIRALSSAALSGSVLLNSQSAMALKPNNEALCGTGFFTNIAQYKCTDIGDISDEGQSRKTTAEEESRLDGLMSKFGDLDLPSSSSSGGADEQSESSDDSASQRVQRNKNERVEKEN